MNNNNGQKLAGKVAVVTGGSRGIGAAIAKRLAADGASVAITYTKGADAAASVVQAIKRGGGNGIAIQADATDAKAVKAAVEKTVATFGRLDVLVNNAGTAIPKTFEEATLEEMDRVIDINIRGITVNNVQPGPIETDLNPATGDWSVPQKAATALKRYGQAEEIAAMVAFVAGPDASYITGANLTVDGGMNA